MPDVARVGDFGQLRVPGRDRRHREAVPDARRLAHDLEGHQVTQHRGGRAAWAQHTAIGSANDQPLCRSVSMHKTSDAWGEPGAGVTSQMMCRIAGQFTHANRLPRGSSLSAHGKHVGLELLTSGVQAASSALPGGRREGLQLHHQPAVGALRNVPPDSKRASL